MRCPYCKSSDTWKIQPLPWMMRIRPRMRNRRCSNCGHEMALWFHRYTYRHSTAHSIVFAWNVAMWILFVLFAADIVRLITRPTTSFLHQIYSAIRTLILSLIQ